MAVVMHKLEITAACHFLVGATAFPYATSNCLVLSFTYENALNNMIMDTLFCLGPPDISIV